MIIIQKKRVIFIAFCVIFAFSFWIAKDFTEQYSKNMKTIETVSTPATDKIIVLDAGHGIPDGGASSKEGISESDINLKIVLKLQKLLEQSGCTVILTRSDENGIYDLDKDTLKQKKISDIKNRVKIGNEARSRYICFCTFK